MCFCMEEMGAMITKTISIVNILQILLARPIFVRALNKSHLSGLIGSKAVN